MNEFLKNAELHKYSYSGATSVHLAHYSDILLDEELQAIIIHAGTNDIYGRNRRNASAQQIAKDIIDIGKKCVTRGVKDIFISSIIATRNFNANNKAEDINTILKSLCTQNNYYFIDNDFINVSHLEPGDQVHLSWSGRRDLIDNYIHVLNN